MSREFVHLHLHTDYSLLDGACAISWHKLKKEEAAGKDDLIHLAKANDMKAIAITDHGVMGGCLEFHNELKANDLKPIIGCETYMAPGKLTEKNPNVPYIKGYHLILLATNQIGYRNLCKLNSEAHVNGFYYKPRIDKELLAQYHEGIIGMSACLQGEIDVAIRKQGVEAGRKVLYEYLDIFGKENFYLELMYHGIEEQRIVNKGLIELSRSTGVPLVATNDVHYMRKQDAKSHEIMLCIGTRTTMDDPNRMRMDSEEFYFKSGDEMFEIFGSETPEAITNTLAIAERCDVTIGYENHYPEYTPPEDFVATLDMEQIKLKAHDDAIAFIRKNKEKKKDATPPTETEIAYQTEREIILIKTGAYLRKLCLYGTGPGTLCGYQKRYGYDPFNPPEDKKEDAKIKLQRMDYELGIINKTRYNSYFLVVWDFINAGKEMGVPVGPGRGSGAGSIVAFLIGITDIDPIKYSLLFERFLNPDRVSPPDFDIDFCERRRGEVIKYVIDKYGCDCVCQIGTYGTLKAKAVVKDVARVLGRKPADGNMITKMIPDDPKMTLNKAIKESPDLSELVKKEAWVKEIFDYSRPIEQLNRQMGIHAAGVIICNQPLADLVPLGRGAHEEVITQYVAPLDESIGLLKMDFLGLRTLTVIQDAVDNVYKNRGIKLDMNTIPLDDKETFNLINKGDTVAVFQLESRGMQELCRSFKAENIKHLIALIAIYRPGPMEFIPIFVGRKNGTMPLEYDHPLMEQYLSETYGIMLYQEQIMQVVQVLAGFRLGEADILRRAIGKKKLDVMEAQHDKFVKGCADTNNIPSELAETIWENIKKFANYGFNKSHSAAYAMMTYRTAYLKTHFRAEFLAAVLTSELTNSSKLTFLINECRSIGIKILPPDVNSSDVNFTVDGENIRFGLGAIKGFGQGVSESIINARKDGPFTTLTDLIERTSGMNSKSIEALIRAGALDSLGLKRSQLVAIIDQSLSTAAANKRDKESGQGSLFDFLDNPEDAGLGEPPPPDLPEFTEEEILADEKALLGFYVSGHPLSAQKQIIDTFSTATLAEITAMPSDIGVKFGALITGVTKKFSKTDNKPYAVLTIEDLTESMECVCYNRLYEEYAPLLVENDKVFIRAVTKKDEEDENATASITIEDICPLDDAFLTNTGALHIYLYETELESTHDILPKLQELLNRNRFNEENAPREFRERMNKAHPVPVTPLICITLKDGRTAFVEPAKYYSLRISAPLLNELDLLLGERHYKLIANRDVPQPRKPWKKKDTPGKEG